MHHSTLPFILIHLLLLSLGCQTADTTVEVTSPSPIRAVNAQEIAAGESTLAILHPQIITGDGETVIPDGCVVVRDDRIIAVGEYGTVDIPEDAETVDARGSTLLPGLVDAHFHLNRMDSLSTLFLNNGVTIIQEQG